MENIIKFVMLSVIIQTSLTLECIQGIDYVHL